jgi:2-oxoglutarate ferredoxin oxidoreductase subunit beta
VLQNCNIFNDGAFEQFTDKERKAETQLVLEHGKPLVFGKARDRGIRMNGHRLEVVQIGNGVTLDDLLVHDQTDDALAFLLSTMKQPEFPLPVGVFRSVQRPTYDAAINAQIDQARQSQPADLDALFNRGDVWDVG